MTSRRPQSRSSSSSAKATLGRGGTAKPAPAARRRCTTRARLRSCTLCTRRCGATTTACAPGSSCTIVRPCRCWSPPAACLEASGPMSSCRVRWASSSARGQPTRSTLAPASTGGPTLSEYVTGQSRTPTPQHPWACSRSCRAARTSGVARSPRMAALCLAWRARAYGTAARPRCASSSTTWRSTCSRRAACGAAAC